MKLLGLLMVGERRLEQLPTLAPEGAGGEGGRWEKRGDSGAWFSGVEKVPRTSGRNGVGGGCSLTDCSLVEGRWGGGGQLEHFGNSSLSLKTTQAFLGALLEYSLSSAP